VADEKVSESSRRAEERVIRMVTFSDTELARLNTNPLYQAVGIRLVSLSQGVARSELRPQAAMCWPTSGRPHGGILFTLLDTTMAFAALSNGPAGASCATVDCSVQYTAPADHGPFSCEATTRSKSARTAFIRAEITDQQGVVVALAQGTFRLFT
jgi:uncharacterized protein (TIGR00369 family)